jgi:hypothetical protein
MSENKLGIVMRETTPDFREGFEFAVNCIYDLTKNREDYSLDKLNELLTTMITLMHNNCWWNDVKHIIKRDKNERK